MGVFVGSSDPATLGPFGDDYVHPLCFSSPGMSYGRYLMEHSYIVGLEKPGKKCWTTAIGYCYPHALFDGGLDQGSNDGIGKIEGYAEGAAGRAA